MRRRGLVCGGGGGRVWWYAGWIAAGGGVMGLRFLWGWCRNRGSEGVRTGWVFRCVGTQGRNNTRIEWAVGCDMKGITSLPRTTSPRHQGGCMRMAKVHLLLWLIDGIIKKKIII